MRARFGSACLSVLSLTLALTALAKANDDPPLPPALKADLDAARQEIVAKRPTEALALLDRSIASAVEQRLTEAEAFFLTEAAGVAWQNNQPQRSLDYHTRSLPLWRRLGNRSREAYALFISAMVLRIKVEHDRAMEYHRASAAIYEDLGDPVMVAENYLNLGLLCRDRGQVEAGLAEYRNALTAARRAAAQGRDAHVQEAHALRMMGELMRESGRLQESLSHLQRARDVHRAAGDWGNEGSVLLSIALSHQALRADTAALEASRESEALAVRAENASLQAHARVFRARVLLWGGRHDEAYKAFREAREFVRKAQELWPEADMLIDLARAAQIRGALTEAFGYLDEAKAIGDKLGDVMLIALVEIVRGNFLLVAGRLPEAEQHLRSAVATAAKGGSPWRHAHALNLLAHVYRTQRKFEEARTAHRQALALREKSGSRGGVARELADLAGLERAVGRGSESARLLNQAVTILEQVREAAGADPQARAGSHRANLDLYHRLLETYYALGMPNATFKWAERAKARALLDLMDSGQIRIRGAATQQELAEEARLRGEAAAASRALEGAGEKADPAKLAPLKERAETAEGKLRLFTSKLFATYPQLAEQRQARTVEIQDLVRFLPIDTVLIEYVVLEPKDGSEERVIALCCTSDAGEGSAMRLPAPLPAANLRKKVEQFRKACATEDVRYRDLARELHGLLIPSQFRGEIAGKKRVVICPDGFLWGLPFQALIRPGQSAGQEKHLIGEHEVTYQYSATATMMSLRRDGAPPALSGKDVAVFARSEFGSELPPLPHVAAEAEAIRRALPGALVYSNRDAGESRAKQEAARFRYLHFATHGTVNDVAPLESGLALARREGDAEDGMLTAREFFDLSLKAELVVLSSCRSGDGEKSTGEGLIGLAWALFAAGARAQALTQWDLQDAAAARFMSAFYRSLAAGREKGEALRDAALDLRRDEKYRHPRYWAPFILLGDWR